MGRLLPGGRFYGAAVGHDQGVLRVSSVLRGCSWEAARTLGGAGTKPGLAFPALAAALR